MAKWEFGKYASEGFLRGAENAQQDRQNSLLDAFRNKQLELQMQERKDAQTFREQSTSTEVDLTVDNPLVKNGMFKAGKQRVPNSILDNIINLQKPQKAEKPQEIILGKRTIDGKSFKAKGYVDPITKQEVITEAVNWNESNNNTQQSKDEKFYNDNLSKVREGISNIEQFKQEVYSQVQDPKNLASEVTFTPIGTTQPKLATLRDAEQAKENLKAKYKAPLLKLVGKDKLFPVINKIKEGVRKGKSVDEAISIISQQNDFTDEQTEIISNYFKLFGL